MSADAQSDPEAVFEELRSTYAAVEALKASFTQKVQTPFGETYEASGQLLVSGDKFRLETSEQIIVADGETTWIHDLEAGQVLISPIEHDQTTFSPTTFLLQLDDSYRAVESGTTTLDGDSVQTVHVRSEAPDASFTSLIFWYDEASKHIRRVKAEDVNDTVLTFDLHDVVLDASVPDGTFAFEIPDDVEVVDLRS